MTSGPGHFSFRDFAHSALCAEHPQLAPGLHWLHGIEERSGCVSGGRNGGDQGRGEAKRAWLALGDHHSRSDRGGALVLHAHLAGGAGDSGDGRFGPDIAARTGCHGRGGPKQWLTADRGRPGAGCATRRALVRTRVMLADSSQWRTSTTTKLPMANRTSADGTYLPRPVASSVTSRTCWSTRTWAKSS